MAIKAAMPRHFSIVVFGLAQVMLDLEVLWHGARHEHHFHTFWHTYLGATIIAAVLAVAGKPASQWIKGTWNRVATKCCDANLAVTVRTTWLAAFTGAVFGAYSHILIDSLFHSDIKPFQPWSDSNLLYGIISRHSVKVACVLIGVAGLAWFIWRAWKRKSRGDAPQ